MMTLDQKILKATLMLRRWGNTYQTKDVQRAEFTKWYTAENEKDLDEWIQSLREDLAKTPEQLEEESRQFIEELAEREAELEYQERMSMWHERDEWDDLWDDRARDCGAIRF